MYQYIRSAEHWPILLEDVYWGKSDLRHNKVHYAFVFYTKTTMELVLLIEDNI